MGLNLLRYLIPFFFCLCPSHVLENAWRWRPSVLELLLALQNTAFGIIDPAAVFPVELVQLKSSLGWSIKGHQPFG